VSGYERLLTGLVAEACIDVCPENPSNFNVDNVRIVKLMGGALPDSRVVKVWRLARVRVRVRARRACVWASRNRAFCAFLLRRNRT
jgi:chaperonin GroEL (HSP60 family)